MNTKEITLFVALGAVAVVVGLSFFSAGSSAVGGVLSPNCYGAAWTNTSSTVTTTAIQVLTAAQMDCPVRLTNDSAANVYCFLEKKTAASSTISVSSFGGIKINSVTSTVGENTVCFGSDAGCVNGTGNNLNCVISVPGRVTILRK